MNLIELVQVKTQRNLLSISQNLAHTSSVKILPSTDIEPSIMGMVDVEGSKRL